MTDSHTQPARSTSTPDSVGARAILWVHPVERLYPLHEGTTLIGRASDAGIQLTGDQVSRRHATLSVSENQIVLRDEGSLNKPRCNFVSLPECRLSNNDVVRIGDWIGVVLEGVPPESLVAPPFETLTDGVLIGPRSRAMWQTLAQMAQRPLAVVIEGESGTGKEVVASAIHRLSGRKGRFVPVNCAAQPDGLFEAQFLGHTKGAFTGAHQAAEGYFAAADHGTLFLDELAELTLGQQAKVLRVVEEAKVTPVGSTQARDVNVRIVSAAQRSLSLAADEGRFRGDLHARLGGVTLRLLPLRERREEIPRLFRAALERELGHLPQLSAGFVERLCLQPWRLNVRELLGGARRCAALYPNVPELSTPHLAAVLDLGVDGNDSRAGSEPKSPVSARSAEGTPAPPRTHDSGTYAAVGSRTRAWLARHKEDLENLRRALQETRGNLSQAARQIGISRHQAQRLVQAAAELDEER